MDPLGHKNHLKLHHLRHYEQKFNWDCGISCIIMLLTQKQRNEFLNNIDKILNEFGIQHSTWTIDLCHLLKQFDVIHEYFTLTIGVNMDFVDEKYYNEIISNDHDRVMKRFDEALFNNIDIYQKELSIESIVRHLSEHGPAIILVDSNLLMCDLCKYNKLRFEFSCMSGCTKSYLGHYIVLCGYNLKKNKLLYRNPTLRDRICSISFKCLDRARKAFGTDQDIILVYKIRKDEEV